MRPVQQDDARRAPRPSTTAPACPRSPAAARRRAGACRARRRRTRPRRRCSGTRTTSTRARRDPLEERRHDAEVVGHDLHAGRRPPRRLGPWLVVHRRAAARVAEHARARSCGRAARRRRAAAGSTVGAYRGSWNVCSHTERETARFTSWPMRSVSAKGPIAEPARLAQDGVHGGGVGRARLDDPVRLAVERPRDAVDDEAGRRRCTSPASSPSRARAAPRRRRRPAVVASPRTTSTSRIRGAGLKKCRPTTRSGRRSAAAIAVTESDDVLVASSVCGPTTSSTVREQLALHRQVLGDRLQDDGAAGERVDVGRRLDAGRASSSASSAVSRPRSTSRSRRLPIPADGLLGRAGPHVQHPHAVPRPGRHLGDAGAHGACPEHPHDVVVRHRTHRRLRGRNAAVHDPATPPRPGPKTFHAPLMPGHSAMSSGPSAVPGLHRRPGRGHWRRST